MFKYDSIILNYKWIGRFIVIILMLYSQYGYIDIDGWYFSNLNVGYMKIGTLIPSNNVLYVMLII